MLKKVETLPAFQTSVLFAYKRGEQPKRWGDSIECDEIWAFVGNTDSLAIYNSLIPYSQHGVAPKGSGATNVAESCNNYLRHRVSYLVRKSMSFARNIEWLKRRLYFVLFSRNERIKKMHQHAK